jgi:hypothetical protein
MPVMLEERETRLLTHIFAVLDARELMSLRVLLGALRQDLVAAGQWPPAPQAEGSGNSLTSGGWR